MRILCVNTLLKVVSPYDLSILSMSVIQKNWIEWGELYIGFLEKELFCKAPKCSFSPWCVCCKIGTNMIDCCHRCC